jgi:hypothetical protein
LFVLKLDILPVLYENIFEIVPIDLPAVIAVPSVYAIPIAGAHMTPESENHEVISAALAILDMDVMSL